MPCEMIVDYRATTGRWLWRAYLMCGAMDRMLWQRFFIYGVDFKDSFCLL